MLKGYRTTIISLQDCFDWHLGIYLLKTVWHFANMVVNNWWFITLTITRIIMIQYGKTALQLAAEELDK